MRIVPVEKETREHGRLLNDESSTGQLARCVQLTVVGAGWFTLYSIRKSDAKERGDDQL